MDNIVKYAVYTNSVEDVQLIATNMSINEISYATGFNSLSNFNRAFKKKFMLTPKEYKLNYKKETAHHQQYSNGTE